MVHPLRNGQDNREQKPLDGRGNRRVAVAFVGSTGLMNTRIAADISEKMSKMPSGSEVLLRVGMVKPPGIFEMVAAELAKQNGHVVRWFSPREAGRSSVYRRDYELVEYATRVEAYFDSERIMEGGTGHVVEAAMARECPVYAWTVDHGGLIVRVGEIETEIGNPGNPEGR